MFNEFKKFVLRGNLVDLAIGFTVGAAFSTVAKSIVDDIIMPPIGLLLGGADFSDLFILLKKGETAGPYNTLADAQSAGAVTLNYGLFINNLLSLLIVAFAMFLIIKFINRLEDQLSEKPQPGEQDPSNKKCPFCISTIDYKATKCPNCTSDLTSKKKK